MDPALRPRVRLAGRVPRDAMPAYFSAADLFVLGSHREGSGYALIEALACGVMPVVTAIASFRALTAEGSVGELWPPRDAAALARALVRAAERIAPSHRAARQAYFDRHFGWPQLGQRARSIYEEVRERRARRRRAAMPLA
jgi:glycosyltransferase involved in cell wall biosynthesis